MAVRTSWLYIDELVTTPKLEVRQVACLPSPEAGREGEDRSLDTACWAPDSSAVLLHYLLDGYTLGPDGREEMGDGWLDVGPLHTQLHT